MSQHATELCLLLVDDIYGELTSRIFGVLLCYGRSTLATLLRRSRLSSRQVKHGLAVLIQQNLALWNTIDQATYYEADWSSAYSLVRAGKLIKIIENRFGDVAAGVMSTLLMSGHAQVEALAQAYLVSQNAAPPDFSKVKSASAGHLTKEHAKMVAPAEDSGLEPIHSVLSKLLHGRFLSIVHESHFRSEADNRVEAEYATRIRPYFQGQLKGEKKAEFEEAVESLLHQWKFDGDLIGHVLETVPAPIPSKGKKRPLEDDGESGGPVKKSRSDMNVTNVTGPSSLPILQTLGLDDQTVLKFNSYKLDILNRNEKLVRVVEERICQKTSQVYSSFLRLYETHLQSCSIKSTADFDDINDLQVAPSVSTADVATAMGESDGLLGSIGDADQEKINIRTITHPKKRRRNIKQEEREVESGASSDEDDEESGEINGNNSAVDEDSDGVNGNGDFKTVEEVKKKVADPIDEALISSTSSPDSTFDLARQHLLLLAEHPYRFIIYVAGKEKRPERWTIDFTALSHRLRLVELEAIISSRYGMEALRIIRILQEKGKLDEKGLSSFSLMNPKSMRSVLTAMHEAGHLELQEVPRDNQRQPSRTMFFWFFDESRCGHKVLEETYKTMARCMQRIKVEREGAQSVIDKAARSDVRGKEDEFLNARERKALEQWRQKEERLLGELGRLDDLVSVLRDF